MIEVSQLLKSFGQQQVLCGVNLKIDRGESVVIIGGSGCGKSVLLRHIIGLVQPDEGDVKIDGQSIADLSERELIKVRRKFGMLFQSSALFDSLTVEENVGFLLDREQRCPRRKFGEPSPTPWSWWTSAALRPRNRPSCPAA